MKYEKKESKSLLHFSSMVRVDDYYWFCSLEWNGYYRMNAHTHEIEFLGMFETADALDDKLFYTMIVYQNFIFFIPWFSDFLVSLNTHNLKLKYWKIPKKIVSEDAKFRAANIYHKIIFMFPHCGNDICLFNIEEEKFECKNDWVADYEKYVKWNICDKFLPGYQKENEVYLPNLSGSFIMRYNLDTYGYELILFPENEKKIVDIIDYNGNKILVLSWKGNVWSYDIDNSTKDLIYQYEGKEEFPYRHIIREGERLYLIPAKEKYIRVIKNGKCHVLNYPSDWELQYIYIGVDTVFNGYFIDKGEIFLCPCLGNKLLVLSREQLTEIEISEESDRLLDKIEHIMSLYNNVISERIVSLNNFIGTVMGEQDRGKNGKFLYETGNVIWNKVR